MKRCGVCKIDITDICLNGKCAVGYHNSAESARPDVDPYEKALNHSCEVGRVAAIEDLAERFRKTAGEHFSRDQDDEAEWYRNLAEQLEAEAKTRRTAMGKTR